MSVLRDAARYVEKMSTKLAEAKTLQRTIDKQNTAKAQSLLRSQMQLSSSFRLTSAAL